MSEFIRFAPFYPLDFFDKGDSVMDKSSRDHIEGIRCDVTNCHYHKENSECSANEIKVGPTYASTSSDTICATFKLDSNNKRV